AVHESSLPHTHGLKTRATQSSHHAPRDQARVLSARALHDTHGLKTRATALPPLPEIDTESSPALRRGEGHQHSVGRTSKSVRPQASTRAPSPRPSPPQLVYTGRQPERGGEGEKLRRLLGPMIAALLAALSLVARADESDYYRIISIDTPKAQTESRSPNW